MDKDLVEVTIEVDRSQITKALKVLINSIDDTEVNVAKRNNIKQNTLNNARHGKHKINKSTASKITQLLINELAAFEGSKIKKHIETENMNFLGLAEEKAQKKRWWQFWKTN